jgi:hypothetical protein
MVPDSEQKYRLGRTFRSQDYSVMSFDGYFGATPEQQMRQLNGFKNIKGVVQACQFYTFWEPRIIRVQNKELTTENILETNTPGAFFDFFGWRFIHGSVDGFRQNLYSAVLTETQAERFFGADWRHQNLTKYEVFKNELEKIPEVTGVGFGSPLGRNPFNQTTYTLEGQTEIFDDAHDIALDYSSIDLLNIKTTINEYVDNPKEAPERVILINETLATKLTNRYGMSRSDLIGRTIIEEPEYIDEETGEVGFPFTIAGTFEDINLFSLREKIDPMFLTVLRDPGYVQWVAVAWEGIGPNAIDQV